MVRLALLFAAFCGCRCPEDRPYPPRDTGPRVRDVGPRDAGPRDAGPPDTGPPRDSGATAWIQLPGGAAGCEIEMATNPRTLVPPLRFEPCPDKPACRQLVAAWPPNGAGQRIMMGVGETGYHDGDIGYFVFGRPRDGVRDPDLYWQLIASDAGDIVAVFAGRRGSEPCTLAAIDIGEGHFALEVLSTRDLSAWILGGELRDPIGSIREIAYLDSTILAGASINYVRVGAQQIVVENTGYHIYRVGWDGTVRRVERGGSPVDANHPNVVGTSIVFEHFGMQNEILISDSGGEPVPLVLPPEPGAEPSVIDRTDGRTLAWKVGYDGGPLRFARVELWASPWATRPDDLRPIRLAEMSQPIANAGVLGAFGHAAAFDGDPTIIRLFRATDGRETTLRAPPGLVWNGFVSFIGPREVLAAAGPDDGNPSGPHQTAVQLIDYTALEPPL